MSPTPGSLIASLRRLEPYRYDTKATHGIVVHKVNGCEEVWKEDTRWEDKSPQTCRQSSFDVRSAAFKVRVVRSFTGKALGASQELKAQIALRQHTTHFVAFYGWYQGVRETVIVTEYLSAGNLGECINEHPDIARQNCVTIAKQILEALEIMHRIDMCHMNLKPKNVLLASVSPLHLKLTDFGFHHPKRHLDKTSISPDMSKYIAPEIITAHGCLETEMIPPGSSKADIWALGAIIHEVLLDSEECDRCRYSYVGYSGVTRCTLSDDCDWGSWVTTPQFRDLVRLMLEYDPSSRISAKCALTHPGISISGPKREIGSLVNGKTYLSYKYQTTVTDGTVTHRIPNGRDEVWKKKDRIGGGGSGEVFTQIMDPSDCDIVGVEASTKPVSVRAVKSIPGGAHPTKLRSIVKELNTLIALREHPDSFVEFYGWYEDAWSTIFIAMEYIPQGDLYAFMVADRKRAKEQCKVVINQVLTALDIMHRNQICHRDIKPQNILVASISPLKIKLTDFGISKSTSHDASAMRTAVGSYRYMAPEAWGLSRYHTQGDAYTNKVDIWAIGVLAHELFTGIVPFAYPESYPERPSSGRFNQVTDLITGFTYGENRSEGGAIHPTLSAAQNIKMDLIELGRYCTTGIPFPRRALDEASAPYSLIDFITCTLSPNPRLRLSASNALEHPWSQGTNMLDPSPVPRVQWVLYVLLPPESVILYIHRQWTHPRARRSEFYKVRRVDQRVAGDLLSREDPFFVVVGDFSVGGADAITGRQGPGDVFGQHRFPFVEIIRDGPVAKGVNKKHITGRGGIVLAAALVRALVVTLSFHFQQLPIPLRLCNAVLEVLCVNLIYFFWVLKPAEPISTIFMASTTREEANKAETLAPPGPSMNRFAPRWPRYRCRTPLQPLLAFSILRFKRGGNRAILLDLSLSGVFIFTARHSRSAGQTPGITWWISCVSLVVAPILLLALQHSLINKAGLQDRVVRLLVAVLFSYLVICKAYLMAAVPSRGLHALLR